MKVHYGKFKLIMIILIGCLVWSTAFTQDKIGVEQQNQKKIEKLRQYWESFTPEKRDHYRELYGQWEKMTKLDRLKMVVRYKKFKQLPREKRMLVMSRFRLLKSLTPERQELIAQRVRKFNKLDEGEKMRRLKLLIQLRQQNPELLVDQGRQQRGKTPPKIEKVNRGLHGLDFQIPEDGPIGGVEAGEAPAPPVHGIGEDTEREEF